MARQPKLITRNSEHQPRFFSPLEFEGSVGFSYRGKVMLLSVAKAEGNPGRASGGDQGGTAMTASERIREARAKHEQLVLDYSGDPQNGPTPVEWGTEAENRAEFARRISSEWDDWFRSLPAFHEHRATKGD